MDMDGGMPGMAQPSSSPATPTAGMNHGNMMGDGAMAHMAFFWGDRSQILFAGWPGERGLGVYFLALVLVAAAAAGEEFLHLIFHRGPLCFGHGNKATACLAGTAVHALQMGLHYLVMLAVMSFNGGVLLAAVVGHAVGFFVARSGMFQWDRVGGTTEEQIGKGRPAVMENS
ncbi:hypothetical protein HPP92_019376 [Vanilla planifolia]|uniref:Copper transport protein n=1 Tax=Vanilla planifolia TaxID=51239 RepID=A0A835Q063_VANPL|nr:hypothetical protein HPP92_019860 [Vanilla planifolia]KAG0465212.1 hypothetical protein HPP92_019376 [Vanilla planifolia]